MSEGEAEQVTFQSAMISLAADREEVRKAALSLLAFELGQDDPTTVHDENKAKRIMEKVYQLDFAGSVIAIQLALWRLKQERGMGRADNEQA